MILCQHVWKRYPNGHEALKDVSFQLNKGELAFLTGHSGAGKSSLLKLLIADETPTQGRVQVAGTELQSLKTKEIPSYRRRIGVIFQNPMLLPDLTIFENTALPLTLRGVATEDIKGRVQGALSKVALLKYASCYPHQLSVGEQQRVGIARAIVHRPEVLLADEPTGNLDPALAEEMMVLFECFLQLGVTVLIATHDQALIQRLPYRVLTLHQGSLVSDTAQETTLGDMREQSYA